MMKKLTIKQENFCQFYIETGNASEAYRRAYPASQKWTDKSVNESASRLVNSIKVAARVKGLQAETAQRNEVTIDKIIQELARVMYFNPKTLLKDDGTMRPINELPDEVAKVVSEIKITETLGANGTNKITTVKTYNKLDAIEKLAKHLGFYEKDNKQKEQQQTVIVLPSNGR